MLASAATEGMVYSVHCNASDDGPFLGLGLELKEALACFDQRFVQTASTGNDPDGRHAFRGEPFHLTTGQLDNGLTGIVSHENGAHSRSSGKLAAVTRLGFDVTDWYALGNLCQMQGVSRLYGGRYAA